MNPETNPYETLKQASDRTGVPSADLRQIFVVFEVPVRGLTHGESGKGPKNANLYHPEDVDRALRLLRSFQARP